MASTKLSAYCSRVIEAGWIAAMVLVPLYFNVYSSRVFEPDKLTLLRSIAVFMAVAWIIKTVEEAGHSQSVRSYFWQAPLTLATAILATVYLLITLTSVIPNLWIWGSLFVFVLAAGLVKIIGEGSYGHKLRHFFWRTPLVLPALALVAIYLLTTLTSVSRFTSLWGSYQRLQGTYTTLAYIVVFFLILNEMRSREQLDRLITAAIVTSVPISLYALMQHYGIDPLPWGGNVSTRVASNMGNSIFVSAYEIMIFFLTLGRIIESFISILTEEEAQVADILRAAAYIFTALIQLITIWFSQSRGPWMGLLVGLFAFVLFGLLALRRTAPDKGQTTWQDVLKALGGTTVMLTAVGFVALLASRRTWKWLWLSWVLLAIVGVGFLVLFNLPDTPLESLRNTPYIGRLGKVFQTESGTGKVRVLIWEGAVKMITPHEPIGYPPEDPTASFEADQLNFVRPLIGYGPESMYVAYNPFYPSDLAHFEKRNASPDRSHNETFDALVITGVIGLAGYMALFGSIFYFGLKWLGWIDHARQKWAFLALYLLLGAVVAVVSVVMGGPEFFGVGLPFGFSIGLVFYAILYALFRDGVEPLAFVFFWGVITALAVGIAALAKSGLVVLLAMAGALAAVGALFYLLGQATFGKITREESTTSLPPILILSLLVGIIAHFVEIHFGIAIAATRTYFWVFAALLVLLGKNMLQDPDAVAATAPVAGDAQPPPPETSTRSRRKKRRQERRTAQPVRKQPVRAGLPAWVGPVLVSAFILTLIMGTLGFNFITNAGRQSADPSCDPQFGRMLQGCWNSQAWNILKHDLTVLQPNRLQNRPTETKSFMTMGLLLLTVLIGSVLSISEMARRGLFKRRREDWGWGALLLVSLAFLLALIALFGIADRHLQLGRFQITMALLNQRFQESHALGDLAELIDSLLDVSMYLSGVLYAFYTFVFLFILAVGAALLLGRHQPSKWATPWGAMVAVPLLAVALFVMNQTNIKVIRADIIYKQGEEWSRQQQWDVAIAHHKRALELAPKEDFYYLWAGSAYLEKSKTAPASPCIITREPNISGVLKMPVTQTAQLCREDLLVSARTILLEARTVNPLNTDHTANLARLYKNWADLATDSTLRQQNIDQSIAFYEQATTLSPQNTIVWNELSTVYLYQKDDALKARELVAHSLELDSRFEQTYMILGDSWVKEAEDIRRQMVAKQQELAAASDADKAALQAELVALQAERDEKLLPAIDAYLQAVEVKPNLVNVYASVASAYEQMGRTDDAIATFEQAIAANPKSAELYLGLGELYRRLGNLQAAVVQYQQAVALAPSNVNARLVLASLLESLERFDEALIQIQEAANLEPADAGVRQNLAFMYQRLQMYPEALAEAQAAAQLAPGDATNQLLIGDISRQMNDLQRAAQAYEQALVINPNLDNAWNVHLNLALIYQQMGQTGTALNHATIALNLAPENQRQQINDFVVQLEQQSTGSP